MDTVTLFLAGDVMTGRGLDQLLAHPSAPVLYEPWIKDARGYVALAEETGGPLPRPVAPSYPWGDALDELARERPAARIVNLETAVTTSGAAWPGKDIHYRMHPDNVDCLQAARLDVAVLANNHVLDWGREGLAETLAVLGRAGVRCAGAGASLEEASRPAECPLPGGGRLRVFACASPSSGVPGDWGARSHRAGVHLLPALSLSVADGLLAHVRHGRRPGDLSLVSLHWGSNWGHEVPGAFVRFAHRLVDGGVDLVHGHSSHHPRPLEIYRDRLVLYGCGDLLNDYEGIRGFEPYRAELALLYLPTLDAATGALRGLRMVPLRRARMRLQRAPPEDARWLADTLTRASARFRVSVTPGGRGDLSLERA